jgi:hypothetical protein
VSAPAGARSATDDGESTMALLADDAVVERGGSKLVGNVDGGPSQYKGAADRLDWPTGKSNPHFAVIASTNSANHGAAAGLM